MENNPASNKLRKEIQWLKFAAIALLTVGIAFRFTAIEQKFYWHDEVINSFGVAGYTVNEAIQELSEQKQIAFAQLQKYQYPNTDKNLFSPVIVLANNEPQNPPLYYLFSWIWLKIFGNSILVARSLSVFISILIFPCIYCLCQELFDSSAIAWMTIILISISPFHLIYAQEARPYSLWSLAIITSSIFLLKAIKSQKIRDWSLYSFSLTLSFYTFPFSLFVAIGHGIYTLARIGIKKYRKSYKYIISSLCSLLAFSPWLIFIQLNSHKISDWRAVDVSFLALIKSWIGNNSRVYFDLNFDSNAPVIYLIPITLSLLLLTIYSVYYLIQNSSSSVWLFILTLIGISAIALIVPDLILGGQRSRVARYLTPCFLGVNLAVGYYLTRELFSPKLWHQLLAKILIILLIISGIISCSVFSQANYWWHKSWTKLSNYEELVQITTVVNQSQDALIVAPDLDDLNEDIFFELLSFTHLLNPETRLQFGFNDAVFTSDRTFIYSPLIDIKVRSIPMPENQLSKITNSFYELKDN